MITTPTNEQHGWSNSAEMLFIKGLSEKKSAKNLLLGYLTGHARRVNFGAIDAVATRQFAEKLLANIETALTSQRAEVA